ncbi:hypothetical protein ACSX1A_10740 [Pontibacter sp. MBLB2868]|uniref:hypothetical protein n=1 Tax=Pontibacter sp. MBLB2868 TaxID=3451555 RepID=UPI003F754CEC
MKKSFYLLALLLFGSGAKIAVAQAGDGITAIPKIVGEGTVSSKDFEFNFTTSSDSSVAFFSKALLPDWRRISIVYSKRRKGAWQKPMLAPFSGHYRDADPFISPDQSKLIFISDRPSKYQKSPSDYTLWMISQPFLSTTEPVQLEGDFYHLISPLYPSLSLNGNLYFSANSDHDSDVYLVKNENGKYKLPVKLTFNSPEHRDLDPIIAPDESFIIFTSTSRKGFGGTDLYVSFQNNGMWSEPVNLGKHINSSSNEGQPGLSPDGKKLYFSTIRPKDKTNYAPRGKSIKTAELEKELSSPFNGLPNIWEVSIESIHELNEYAKTTSN